MIQPENTPTPSTSKSTPPGEETSLWELLGRGVGKTLKAAKEVGSTLGQEAVRFANREDGEEQLDERYRVLGRVVAGQIIEYGDETISASDPAISRTVQEIRELRSALEKVEEGETPADDPAN